MEKIDYIGRRHRLKNRFKNAGHESLEDYELLELFLYLILPRRDTKPIAKKLLRHFKTFDALIQAEENLLQEIEGVGASVSFAIKIYGAMIQRHYQKNIIKKPIFSSWEKVINYCARSMSYHTKEQLRLFFLDSKKRLIRDEVQQIGTVDQVAAYPREITKRALDLGASGIIIAHNHPSGDATPSASDIKLSTEIFEGAKHLGIILYDHIIIGNGEYFSLRSAGFINEAEIIPTQLK